MIKLNHLAARSALPVHSRATTESQTEHVAARPVVPMSRPHRVLMVDLNNFPSFPTLAVGLLVAALRNAGHEVRVTCPQADDLTATERERREVFTDSLRRRLHLST